MPVVVYAELSSNLAYADEAKKIMRIIIFAVKTILNVFIEKFILFALSFRFKNKLG